jgi:hypothetical protein
VRGDDDLAHYMHATGRLRKNVRILVRIAKRLRDERDQLADALAEERHQVAVESGEADRLEALLEREAQVNKGLIVTAESLAAAMMDAEAERDQLRAVVERATRRVEQEQFRGDNTKALSGVYRILCDESITTEPDPPVGFDRLQMAADIGVADHERILAERPDEPETT